MNFIQRMALWSLVAGVMPRSYIEIGTAKGGSAAVVNDAVKMTNNTAFKGVCIDIRFNNMTPETKAELEERFHFLEMSMGIKAMQAAKKLCDSFDIGLVDALHDKDNAVFDILTLWPYISPGGYVLLDDANYLGVEEAVADIVAATNAIDCGKMCRHGGNGTPEKSPAWVAPMDRKMPETVTWGGLYVLRKPV